MQLVPPAFENSDVSLWRLAAKTIARTLLWFTLPYLLAYYTVVGAWQGIRSLLLMLAP